MEKRETGMMKPLMMPGRRVSMMQSAADFLVARFIGEIPCLDDPGIVFVWHDAGHAERLAKRLYRRKAMGGFLF